MTQTNEFAVWIGCLACYNAGRLVGEWFPAIDAGDVTPDQIHGKPTSHEELWVMDLDNSPIGVDGEMSPSEAQRIAEALEDVPADEREAFAAWCANNGVHITQADHDEFEDAYCGEWDSQKDYAYQLAEDIGFEASGAWPASYIDWDAATRDLFMDYTAIQRPEGGIWVFRDC